MLRNIQIDEAVDILFALDVNTIKEEIPLWDAAGRVLAADITAAFSVPPFDRSPFDGYAFRGEDTRGATRAQPVTLRITEEIPAGTVPGTKITPGSAAKILTGGPIPAGANATVKYEDTRFTADTVTFFEPVPPNTNIVRAGDDFHEGALLAAAGTPVSPPLLGIFASQGLCAVAVWKKPRISILNTGSELVEPGRPLPPAMIYNSNVYTLHGYISDMGAQVRNAGVVADDPDEIARRIGAELESSDMVITTGGASVGDYDWAVTSAQRLGARVLFWKVSMKPGGSMMAAVKDGKLILGLSGNPGAAVLGLLRIAAPYIRKLCGRADLLPPLVDVLLKAPYKKASPKRRLLRGKLEISDGRALFTESAGQGNGVVLSMVGCDLLGEIPAGSPPLPAGSPIRAWRL